MLIEDEIAKIKRKICVQYMYGIIIVLASFAGYYCHESIEPIGYFFCAFFATHLIIIFVPHFLNYETLKPLITVYLLYIGIFLYLEIIYFWFFQQAVAFLWSFLLFLAVSIFFEKKTATIWNISIFISLCSIFIVTHFIPKGLFSSPTNDQMIVINIMTVILCGSFILFFVYYIDKIDQVKTLLLNNYEAKEENYVNNTETGKFEKLYTAILNYFSEKKPYCNPDFTIVQLAEALDSNVKYISTAIKNKENVHFITFLNRYRINLVKEKIALNDHNKYTLSYIYNLAGFRHQSTFNKAFKEIEGITPSEYIKSKTESKH